jgi:hypothetical protein
VIITILTNILTIQKQHMLLILELKNIMLLKGKVTKDEASAFKADKALETFFYLRLIYKINV